jgi:peptide deformylase
MALLEVLTWPNPILKKKSIPVDVINSELKTLADDMLETMYEENGIGLAAPQIGQNIRLIVIDVRPRDEDDQIVEDEMTELELQHTYPMVLLNPKVIAHEEKTTFEEGCLSVPGFNENVTRARVIEITALSLDGKELRFRTDGLLAICIQHEIDHLDGKLFIDRLSMLQSELIKAKIKKFGYKKDKDAESADDGDDSHHPL